MFLEIASSIEELFMFNRVSIKQALPRNILSAENVYSFETSRMKIFRKIFSSLEICKKHFLVTFIYYGKRRESSLESICFDSLEDSSMGKFKIKFISLGNKNE